MRDKDTLLVGRIDLVEDRGVTRVTLAADGAVVHAIVPEDDSRSRE